MRTSGERAAPIASLALLRFDCVWRRLESTPGVAAASQPRRLAPSSGRRRGVSLLSSSLALKVPQPPLVAPRRLLTSAAATMPPALGALSGLAELPRRRRLRARSDQRAPFLDSDGVSGNQVHPYAAQFVSADAVSHAFGDYAGGVADKGQNMKASRGERGVL